MNENDQKIIARGRAAEDVLNNEAFQGVQQIIQLRYLENMMGSGIEEVDVREVEFRKLYAMREFIKELQSWVADKITVEINHQDQTFED